MLQRLSLSLLHLLSLVFLILVLIGNTHNRAVLRDTYFLKINLSNIIPRSVPNAVLINSIARSIGLHDFYQVGVWNFCEGYDDGSGITYCSTPRKLYWFNPVEILLNELLAGATIALPAGVTNALKIVHTASNWMFGLFIVGAVLTFLCILLTPFSISSAPRNYHRGRRILLRSLPLILLTFFAALTVTAASVIATVMFIIFRNVFSGAADLNIQAEIGKPMLAFMWIASGFGIIGFVVQFISCCCVCCTCCGARRRKAEKRGNGQNGFGMREKESNGGTGVKRRLGWRSRRVEV